MKKRWIIDDLLDSAYGTYITFTIAFFQHDSQITISVTMFSFSFHFTCLFVSVYIAHRSNLCNLASKKLLKCVNFSHISPLLT
jgi:hypothetical protein